MTREAPARHPRGTAAGGRFATTPKPEGAVDLGARAALRRDATEAVTSRVLPLVRGILERDRASHPDPISDWDSTAYAATDAVLRIGPGHGDLIFSEADLRTTAYSVISHHVSPAIALARMDARDGRDVDWTYVELRCQMAADTLVTALDPCGRC